MSDWLPAKYSDEKMSVLLDQVYLTGEQIQREGYVIEESKFINSPVAQVPSDGYTARDNFSMASIKWLEWFMEETKMFGTPIHIRHALNGGEVQLLGTKYRLDGYCADTNTAYEFNGCFWHGCHTCFPNQRHQTKLPRTNQSVEELWVLTLKKQYIKSQGMKLVSIWGYEFNEMLQGNESARTFVDSLDLQDRLNPRDSFFGGRTNATKLFFKVNNDEKIHYLDFCSLFPSVNKYAKYPLREPQVITQNFQDVSLFWDR